MVPADEQPDRNTVTAAILAGGRGSRMGNRDKGLVVYRGRPLIEAVLQAVRPQVGPVLIVANRNQARYADYGMPVFPDVVSGYLGPLAGMLTAATHAETDLVLTVPCDVPHLPADLADRLYACMQAENAVICCAHDGQRLQPMVCLWQRSLAPTLAAAVNNRQLQLRAWIRQHACCVADFSDCPDCFDNLNEPRDLDMS